MGRGVSCGGGRSSLGYLFGSESDGVTTASNGSSSSRPNKPSPPSSTTNEEKPKSPIVRRAESKGSPISWEAQQPSAQPGHLKNNYYRSEGQNCGNFITDRPTTKVHAAPGGGSSLGYLFGDPNQK